MTQISAQNSNYATANDYKLSGMKSTGKGISTKIKTVVPIYGSYVIGNTLATHKENRDKFESIKNGTTINKKEDSAFMKTVKGFGTKILLTLPFVGSYMLGKAVNEHEQLKQDIADYKNGVQSESKSAGVLKNWGKGFVEKLKLAIPFYSAYHVGQMVGQEEAISKDLENMSKGVQQEEAAA